MMTKTVLKTSLFTLAFAAANAYAFYGTEIKNYRANPWLDTLAASSASAHVGATARQADTGQKSSNPALDRFFAEENRASQLGGN